MPLWSRYYLENGFAFWITHVKKKSTFNVNVTTESNRIALLSAVMECATQWMLEFNCLIHWDATVSIKSPWTSSVLCHYSFSFETMLGLYLIIRWKWCNAYTGYNLKDRFCANKSNDATNELMFLFCQKKNEFIKRTPLLYGSECWTPENNHEQHKNRKYIISLVKMRNV